MPVVLKSTHLEHGGMTQTAQQSCEVQELCKEGKQYPNNGILKGKKSPRTSQILLSSTLHYLMKSLLLTFSLSHCSWQMGINDQIPLEKSPGKSSINEPPNEQGIIRNKDRGSLWNMS